MASEAFKTISGMAQSFIACDREQAFLMAPDVRDWLSEGHLAWFVLDAVEAMDLTAFYAAYRDDGRCRPAYEPSMMVTLLCCTPTHAGRGRHGRSSGPARRTSP